MLLFNNDDKAWQCKDTFLTYMFVFFSWPSRNSHVLEEILHCPASQPRTSELPTLLLGWQGTVHAPGQQCTALVLAYVLTRSASTVQTATWPQVPKTFSYSWRSISNKCNHVIAKFNKALYNSVFLMLF